MQDSPSGPIVGLNDQEKIYLLNLVRTTIVTVLETGELPETKPVSEKMKEKYGVFVTLHKEGNLRGCIGYIEGLDQLYKSVMSMAKSAAFQDPRFPPVEMKEVDRLEIEISVLSPIKKIGSVDEIQVGKHGLIIQQGPFRGLLLPQVATEWGWDKQQFLEQTCRKAGLSTDAWKNTDTDIYIFSAEIFSENEFD
ncbi:MAG: AmmeMemoRadiSam system protein A [bacterium]|nr:MAG: AmmeMemoRadiSam system protein A [bacterium]